MAVLTDFLVLTVKIFRYIVHSVLQWIIKPAEKTVANEICLITGAGSASGIGRFLALEFAQRRATLVLWDVDSEGNENTAREVRELGVRAYAYTCDVSRREEVYAAAEKVRRDVGDVTILVNNASIIAGKPILQCADELLERTMRTNCHAHFWVSGVPCNKNKNILSRNLPEFLTHYSLTVKFPNRDRLKKLAL